MKVTVWFLYDTDIYKVITIGSLSWLSNHIDIGELSRASSVIISRVEITQLLPCVLVDSVRVHLNVKKSKTSHKSTNRTHSLNSQIMLQLIKM